MRRVAIDKFIALGITLRYLRGVVAGEQVHGDLHILAQIESLQAQLDQLGLRVTHTLSRRILSIRPELAKASPPVFLDDAAAEHLRQAAARVEETLLAESTQREVYEAAETRHRTTDLMDAPERLLSAGTFAKMQPASQRDFAEAGRCLVCLRSTASAFHVLRATEGELRTFYERWVKRGRIAEPRMWGPMCANLRSKHPPPTLELLDLLDHIRKSFRNPTQHPDAEYSLDQAQDLYALCSDAISRMVNHVNR